MLFKANFQAGDGLAQRVGRSMPQTASRTAKGFLVLAFLVALVQCLLHGEAFVTSSSGASVLSNIEDAPRQARALQSQQPQVTSASTTYSTSNSTEVFQPVPQVGSTGWRHRRALGHRVVRRRSEGGRRLATRDDDEDNDYEEGEEEEDDDRDRDRPVQASLSESSNGTVYTVPGVLNRDGRPLQVTLQCALAMDAPIQYIHHLRDQNVAFVMYHIWMLVLGVVAVLVGSVTQLWSVVIMAVAAAAFSSYEIVQTNEFHRVFHATVVGGACAREGLIPRFWSSIFRLDLGVVILSWLALAFFIALSVRLSKAWTRERPVEEPSVAISWARQSLGLALGVGAFFIVGFQALSVHKIFVQVNPMLAPNAPWRAYMAITCIALAFSPAFLAVGVWAIRRSSKIAFEFMLMVASVAVIQQVFTFANLQPLTAGRPKGYFLFVGVIGMVCNVTAIASTLVLLLHARRSASSTAVTTITFETVARAQGPRPKSYSRLDDRSSIEKSAYEVYDLSAPPIVHKLPGKKVDKPAAVTRPVPSDRRPQPPPFLDMPKPPSGLSVGTPPSPPVPAPALSRREPPPRIVVQARKPLGVAVRHLSTSTTTSTARESLITIPGDKEPLHFNSFSQRGQVEPPLPSLPADVAQNNSRWSLSTKSTSTSGRTLPLASRANSSMRGNAKSQWSATTRSTTTTSRPQRQITPPLPAEAGPRPATRGGSA